MIGTTFMMGLQRSMERLVQSGTPRERAYQQHQPDQHQRHQAAQKRSPADRAGIVVLQSSCKMKVKRDGRKSGVNSIVTILLTAVLPTGLPAPGCKRPTTYRNGPTMAGFAASPGVG